MICIEKMKKGGIFKGRLYYLPVGDIFQRTISDKKQSLDLHEDLCEKE